MGVVLFNLVALGIETGTSGAVDRSSISTLLAARKRILTGIRPTGPLHLGRYAGALENWLKLQDKYDGYFLIADYQVADRAHDLPRVRNAVSELALDWLAVGLDPERASFVIESGVPEHTELTTWLAWFLPIGLLERTPTLKAEMEAIETPDDAATKGRSVPAMFYIYPLRRLRKVRAMYAGPPRGAIEPGKVRRIRSSATSMPSTTTPPR